MVGEMSVRVNVLVGKCPVGQLSFRELSVRGNVRSGKCPSGKCQLGISSRGILSLGSVRSGNCPTIAESLFYVVQKVFPVPY